MNRALRAATMGALLLSPIALTACSAGNQAQTITQERDQNGAQAQLGPLVIRLGVLEHTRGAAYDSGDDAELRLAIVNTGEEADTLTGVDGDGFSAAEITGPSTSGSGASDQIEIGPNQSVYIGEGDYTITLTGLRESLTVGQYVDVVLSFEVAGEVTIPVSVATPDDAERRGESYDFHGEGSE